MSQHETGATSPDAPSEDIVPQCIYFYLVPGSHGTADVYFYDNQAPFTETGSLPKKLHEMRENALAAPEARTSHPCGWNLSDLRWRRKAYVAVALKDGSLDTPAAVEFFGRDENKHLSFQKSQVVNHPTNATAPRIFCCVNLMLNKEGNPLADGHKSRVKVKVKGHWAAPVDDTGTNMGPPVPPPAKLTGPDK